MTRYSIIFCITILFSNTLFSQKFSGKILDKDSNEELAFVNIIYNSKNYGTSSDIDGYFFIENFNNIEFLKISYIGYEEQIINKEEIGQQRYIVIKLQKSALYLSEVVILPGINPSHRIINTAIENADKNNPEKMRSFSYISYNRFHLTSVAEKHTNPADSIDADVLVAQSFLDSITSTQHLFLTEAVTERKFRYPDNSSETVLAQKVSGLKTPSFTILASQFQSISFYNNYVSILGDNYLSPLSKGSTKQYYFQIEDTVYNQTNDTIFIISYQPLRNKSFKGLEGLLYINTNGYALQNVIAKLSGIKYNINIQQKYELIEDTQWFPVQLNTDFDISILSGSGKTYIYDISLNPEHKRKEFNQYEVTIKDDSHKKDENFWSLYRKESLSDKDMKTYKIIDSISQKYNFDFKLRSLEILASGYIPYKFINIDIGSIYWYNNYEGHRLGLRLKTNERLLPWVFVSGYFGYGIKDKAWKYGGDIDFILQKKSETHFVAGYSKDLALSDNISFMREKSISFPNMLMPMFFNEMDSATHYYTSLKFTSLKYLKTDIKFSYTDKNLINLERYEYLHDIDKKFSISELSFSFRYAYKEKYMKTPKGSKLSLGTKYPILNFNIKKGLEAFDSKQDYLKIEASISKKFTIRNFGETNILISGALIDGTAAYSSLYYIAGIKSWLSFDNCFNTMRLNEFIADRFVVAYLKHNFGRLFKKTKKRFAPELAITSAAGWGDARLVENSTNDDFAKIMNKGYYESGVQINNILILNAICGYGLGVYYKYGPYNTQANDIKNWAFKLTVSISLNNL